jgi:hypothetical protein
VSFVMLLGAGQALAGFSGTDLFIPFVGRGPGVYPSNWFTTVWIYNPSASSVSVDITLLERNKNNVTTAPPKVTVTIAAGETKLYENIVEDTFGKQVYAALRIQSTEKVVATSRTFSKESASSPLNQSFGQDFAAVPASFAIGLSESAEILGGYQTVPAASSEARFNIGCVETKGATTTVRWTARDALGAEQDTFDKAVPPLSQVQGAFKDYFPAVSLTNSRLSASVISGGGAVICYGSMITNDSTLPKPVQDPTTFDMQYPDSALTTPNLTGLFHGAVWSTDGLVVEGGLELEIGDLGVVSYAGAAGLECGADLYTLDLSDVPASPLAIETDGDFTGSVVIAYEDGGATVFTTTWTLAGNRDENGIVTGTLRSDTTGGAGDWAACNGANVVRAFRAGWTENP